MGLIPDQEDPLVEKMAAHSSILAWRILCTEEPDGLQFIGSQRVEHGWVTNTHTSMNKEWLLNKEIQWRDWRKPCPRNSICPELEFPSCVAFNEAPFKNFLSLSFKKSLQLFLICFCYVALSLISSFVFLFLIWLPPPLPPFKWI